MCLLALRVWIQAKCSQLYFQSATAVVVDNEEETHTQNAQDETIETQYPDRNRYPVKRNEKELNLCTILRTNEQQQQQQQQNKKLTK